VDGFNANCASLPLLGSIGEPQTAQAFIEQNALVIAQERWTNVRGFDCVDRKRNGRIIAALCFNHAIWRNS
jgi:hypothetical protein